MIELTTQALGAFTEDELKTMLIQRYPMIKPDEIDLSKCELIAALVEVKNIINY